MSLKTDFLPAVQGMAIQQAPAVESGLPLALEDLKYCSAPSSEERTRKELVTIDAEKLQEKELFQDFACFTSGLPMDKQVEESAPSHIARRNIRLDKKNSGCDIPTAKRAEFRRAEAFGENPKLKSKGKATEEVLYEKIQFYLQMYKNQHTPVTPQAMEVVRALVASNA